MRLLLLGSVLALVFGNFPIYAQEPTNVPIQPAATYTPTTIPAATPTFGVIPTFAAVPTQAPAFVPTLRSYSWPIPSFDSGIQSPTPYSASGGTGDENAGPLGDASNFLSTAEAVSIYLQTPTPMMYDGTVVDDTDFENYLLLIFSYLKGIDPDDFGNLSILVRMTIIALLYIVSFKTILLLIQFAGWFLSWMKKLIDALYLLKRISDVVLWFRRIFA